MLSSPVKDGRRVLGEKTTNASSISRNNKDSATTSPIKPTRDPQTFKLLSSSSHAGQKRSIDQLDGVSSPSKTAARAQHGGEFHIYGEGTQTIASSKEKPQNESPTPTEINTPTSPLDGNTTQPQSFLDSVPNEKADKQPFTPQSSVPIDPEARKIFIQEKAGLLKTRLQTAAKKSTNNQIDRRLSALEAHCRNRKSIPRPTSTSTSSPADPNITPKAKTPKLLPAPDLCPTPYSPRHNTGNMPSSPPASTGSERRVEEESGDTMTPVQSQSRPQPNTPAQAVQLSSPPGTTETQGKAATGSAETPVQNNQGCRSVAEMITASENVDKGEAVDGLVKLMKTTEEYDNLDQ